MHVSHSGHFSALFLVSGIVLSNAILLVVRADAAVMYSVVALGHIGTDSQGYTRGGANGINNVGTVVGYEDKYSSSGTSLGTWAVRWSAGSTVATVLAN